MLEFYVGSDLKLRQLRQCPVGKHLNGFAGWLRVAGYKQRPAQLTLRSAAHLGHWASAHGVPAERVDDVLSDAFARHLPTCACPHAFQGRDDYHASGARRFSYAARPRAHGRSAANSSAADDRGSRPTARRSCARI